MHFEFEHNISLRASEYALDILVCAVGSVFSRLIKSEMQIFWFLESKTTGIVVGFETK